MNWEILLKYINKEESDAEDRQVEEWLNEQKENSHVLEYLQKRKQQLQQPLKQSDIHQQWVILLDRIFESKPEEEQSRPFKLYSLIGIAASILLVSVLGWFYLQQGKSSADKQIFTLQTPANSRGRLTLPDGTLVYMGPASKITYDGAFGSDKRVLHLSGEAFFDVKHIAKKPFVIYTENQLAVTVLGTSFNVYSHKNHNIEVKVATGLVGITANHQTKFLRAGEQLNYQAGNGRMVTAAVDYKDAAALQNETLFFKNDGAVGIAAKLSRWYNIDVEVLPSAARHPRFSGEMKDTGINNLMKGLCYATGLQYRYKDPHTILLF
ncbi:FecR family protein [Mucilaginibacter paludis]|uniref:Anti-FecI sigma factor, FecR n=1 Tax=Mucilaginibacter paludis DSM 18603 TaxID=714943 RepID=H1Y797_9SPHI|nr:FecR family protein [Mucilaginibacter paludis]EHQ28984.1 anti-FecI sigma factor, FecR [Mucilaginibacter paludis DSM 18603]